MEFKTFNKQIQNQFDKMCQTGKLFRVKVTTSKIWETYLNSFKPENNIIFRDPESSEHNCNCCHNFTKRYGNIVSINSDGNLESIFSNIINAEEYQDSVNACKNLITNSVIENVFFETYSELDKNLNYESVKKNQNSFLLGVKSNFKKYTQEEVKKFGIVNTKDVYEFEHFNINLPTQFVDKSGKSIEQIMAHYRDKYQVFKRAMKEISLDTLNLVKDLINQGSLLDGTAHLHAVEEISKYRATFDTLGITDNMLWNISYSIEERTAKFKNTLIGVLCTELAEGLELNKACENWNKRVDPINYHKVTAPITKKQINEAKKFVEENNYTESFDRKLATIDDIKISEILHSNIGSGKIKSISIFDNVKATSAQHKRAEFDKIEEISIGKFMKDILPTSTYIEAYLENKMEGNLVTLTKASKDNSKSIFKWSNNYSWTFNGNLAGKSQIEEMINKRGGKTTGVLNIRLHFPNSTTDYDLCVTEPTNTRITYQNVRKTFPSSGKLDLDAQGVDGIFPPEERVENINYTDLKKMPKGRYSVEIVNYGGGTNNGFTLEIKTLDSISKFSFRNSINGKRNIILYINFDGTNFTLDNFHPRLEVEKSETLTKDLWNLKTNNFHKVNLICLSPNHWGDNKIGNLHYFFMLDNCKTNSKIRSFHNENLIEDLLKHKKVLEVLGATNIIEPSNNQLSGLGFNSTIKDELIVKVKGSHQRLLKIKF